ncbi:MAG: ABC transporter permease [Alphaproteobacteria bacterium]|nr:ABC transporter permease [Alphaproteobacteria bacterium]
MFNDFKAAALAWRQWLEMSLTEVVMHYRRSILGPFWLVLNNLVMIGALGMVYSFVFNMNVENYMPFLAVGLVAWNFLSSFVTGGAGTFIQHASVLKNVNLPLPFYSFKVVCRLVINFAHDVFVLLPVMLIFPQQASLTMFLAIPALILYIINGVALSILLGMLCSRFRDMQNVISNFMQIMFFFTPIFWPASNVSKPLIYEANIFYHYIEIVRAPFLGQIPTLTNWLVVGGVTLVLWVAAIVVYYRYRWRVVHTI